MATETADSAKPLDHPRAQRLSILAAARRVMVRDGASAISLPAVAAEAGVAPEILNGHFENAQELLLALAADDLASMAHAMHPHAAAEDAAAPDDADKSQGARPGGLLKRKNHMPPTLEQVMKEVAPDANASAGSGMPLARIERRIQMIEKAFADMGERQEKILRERGDGAAAAEQSILALRQRLDASEQGQAEIVAALKKTLKDIHIRVNGLEVVVHPAQATVPAADPAQALLDFEPPPARRQRPAEERDAGAGISRRCAPRRQ